MLVTSLRWAEGFYQLGYSVKHAVFRGSAEDIRCGWGVVHQGRRTSHNCCRSTTSRSSSLNFNQSPTTMFRKLFVPVFLLLAFAAHSALGVITSITNPTPNHVIKPGDSFAVDFHTNPPRVVEFCVAFGLNLGTNPPPDHDLGRFRLTSPGTCFQLGNDGITPPPTTFTHFLVLPQTFPTTPRSKLYTLTAAVFRVVS